jgi:HSP20 family protein
MKRTSPADPWRELWELHERVEQVFSELARPAVPAPLFRPPTEVLEDASAYTLRFDLPGLTAEAITLQLEEGTLWLSGVQTAGPEEGRLLRGERRSGRFAAAVPLPRDADPSALAAELDQGVLTVTLPRRVVAAARRIPISRKEPA